MPRRKGYDGAQARQREALENALGALVRVEYIAPITRLRVEQAARRPRVRSLLAPALGEMDDMTATVRRAKAHVLMALSQLLGEDGNGGTLRS